MRPRFSLVAAPLLVVALAAPGLAAPKPPPPQIVDPKGDSTGGQGGHDIVSVAFTTTGTGKGRAYSPKKLIVTLTLAAAPRTEGAFSYTVKAETDSCGRFNIKYAPGNAIGGVIGDTYATFGSCGESVFFPAKVKGSVVSFEFGLKLIGIDRGTEFSEFVADVDVSDPALAIFGTGNFGPTNGVLDAASGDGTWVIP